MVEMTGKRVKKEREDMDAILISIGKFKSEYFDATEDGFHKLLYMKMGTSKADLRYVIC